MSGKKTVYWSPRHWIYFKATGSILCLYFFVTPVQFPCSFLCTLFLSCIPSPSICLSSYFWLFASNSRKLELLIQKAELFSISLEDRLELSRVDCSLIVYTAISRKVVGKSARDNPDRYCGWFWVRCSSKKFERMAREAMDVCLRVLKERNKRNFDSYCLEQCIDHIPHYLSGSSGAHFCRQPFSK